MSWKLLNDSWEEVGGHRRVLIYTEGTDFAGQQFFDVSVEDLYTTLGEEDSRPEECQHATHWMPLPYPTA